MDKKNSGQLIIHIGTPKTGTSAIQRFLYENNNVLKGGGWCYPDLVADMEAKGIAFPIDEGEKCKNGVVGYKFVKGCKGHCIDTKCEEWEIYCGLLISYLQNYNVILSEESIWWWNTVDFLSQLKKVFPNIKIIVYLRRQDRYIESDWNQRVKRYAYNSLNFKENVAQRQNDSIFNYLKKLREIEDILGIENMIVRVYEKAQYMGIKGDICSDFLYALGIPVDEGKCRFVQPQNESLTGNYLEIKKQLNRLIAGKKGRFINTIENEFLAYAKSNNSSSVRGVGGYFEVEERKEVLDHYADDNEVIARRYLHREDGILFYDNNMNIPKDVPDYNTIFQDTMRVMDIVINNFYKEERYLLIMKHCGEKKLALFGAGINCRRLIESYQFPVHIIIDNSKEKSGMTIKDKMVIWSGFVKDWKNYFIIITVQFPEQIIEQLELYGLKKGKDFISAKEYGIIDK